MDTWGFVHSFEFFKDCFYSSEYTKQYPTFNTIQFHTVKVHITHETNANNKRSDLSLFVLYKTCLTSFLRSLNSFDHTRAVNTVLSYLVYAHQKLDWMRDLYVLNSNDEPGFVDGIECLKDTELISVAHYSLSFCWRQLFRHIHDTPSDAFSCYLG